ncbi:hypothetical protein M011DRAFT_296556 [Sporormia fimetaria CBS 119925]|uniref:Uncharacterized protein n=1 Tax=Sporormia fimetaria CBS 119925 TaxID=1340428 RepID=A0A6A6UX73_9PLEO|nr:hypothetical protein M011DRAFT_296556 [Sporormia fimetaria CBS 119925]
MYFDPWFADEDRFGPLSPGIFDGSSFFHWDDLTRVLLPNGTLEIPTSHLSAILPRFCETLNAYADFDVIRLSATLSRKLHKSRCIDRKFIFTCLSYLFGALHKSNGQPPVFTSRIYQHLTAALRQDGFGHLEFTEDLRNSRRLFIVYALLARRMDSTALAHALVSFFLDNSQTIVGREDPLQLGAWGLALMDLLRLSDMASVSKCFRVLAERLHEIRESVHYMPYYAYDQRWPKMMRFMEDIFPWRVDHLPPVPRGRRALRPLMCDTHPRARTVPPLVRRPPQWLLGGQDPHAPIVEALVHMNQRLNHVDHGLHNVDNRVHHLEHQQHGQLPLMLM